MPSQMFTSAKDHTTLAIASALKGFRWRWAISLVDLATIGRSWDGAHSDSSHGGNVGVCRWIRGSGWWSLVFLRRRRHFLKRKRAEKVSEREEDRRPFILNPPFLMTNPPFLGQGTRPDLAPVPNLSFSSPFSPQHQPFWT